MAKLPALVTALAQTDGRDRSAVDHIARTIREHGYITTGKRGGGAADMTTREAANLLIALNGSDSPKEAPLAIDRFRSLRQMFAGNSKTIRERLNSYESQIKPLRDVMDTHTFGEALEALIDGVPDLVEALRAYSHIAYSQMTPEQNDRALYFRLRSNTFGIDITFSRYSANIEMYTMYIDKRRVEFEAAYVQDETRIESGFYGTQWPDRRIQVTIGSASLIAAWQALNPGVSLPGIPDRIPSPDDEAAE